MKQNQHKLDDFLKGKVEEADFRMPDSEWQRMSALLDEQDTKKRAAWWKSWLMIALIGLISLGAFFGRVWWQLHQTEPTNLSSNRTESSPTNENHSHSTHAENSKKAEPRKENGTKASIDSKVESENKHTPSESANQTNNQTQPIALGHSKSTHSSSSFHQESDQLENKAKSPVTESVPPSAKNPLSHATVKNASTDSHPTLKSVADNHPEISKSEAKGGPKNSKQKNHSPLPKSETNSQNEAQVPTTNKQSPIGNTQMVKGKPMLALDTEQYVQRRHRDETMYNPRYVKGLENYTATALDSITVITYQAATEKNTPKGQLQSEPGHTNIDSSIKSASAIHHSLNWYLLGGLSLNKGFRGTSSSGGIHATPYIGIGAHIPLTKRLQMAAHIGFTYFSGLHTSETVTSYQYSFGIDSSSFQVQYQKLLQVYMPLSLQYAVTRKQAISVQLGGMYNADVMSTITEASWSVNNGYGSSLNRNGNTSSKPSSGYRDGFQSFDIMAGLGYQYQMNDHLQWQMMLQQGLLDMTRNTYFKQNQSDKQTRLLIGVRYTFKRS